MTTESTDLRLAPQWSPRVAPIPIRSADDYRAVGAELLVVKQFTRAVESWFKPLKASAKAAWDGLVKAEREALAPARAWEEQCKQALLVWERQEQERRLAEQRRLAEEARKAEEERRLAEAAALEAEALAEGDEAKLAEAHAMVAAPVETPVVTIEKPAPPVEGISYREVWDAEVTDFGALVAFVAANPRWNNLLVANEVALRDLARSLRENMDIPGVRAFSRRVVAARAQ